MNISKILFVIGAIVCLPLYGFLCITNLDPTTGFFSSSNLLTTVFYGVLIAVPVLIILLSTVIQKRFAFSISNSRMLGVLSLLMGALMIASGVIHLMNLLSSAFSAVMFSTLIITALQIVMAALSGIVFLHLGICYFKENISNRGSLTFLFPLVWALIACVEMFRDYPQIAGMPERTLYLLCLLSFTLFLMGQSRILSDVDFIKGVRWINAFGMCAALFGLTMTAGEIAAFSSMSLPVFDVLLAFMLSLYCLAFSFNTYIEK